MPHPAKYLDAHHRHWKDAELLFQNARWASADQMYGFSAECGLKAVMKDVLGIPVDDPKEKEKYWKHMPVLWPMFRTFAQGHGGSGYLSQLPEENPFRDWSIGDRYAHRQHWKKASLAQHRHAARGVLDMVQTAKQDGQL